MTRNQEHRERRLRPGTTPFEQLDALARGILFDFLQVAGERRRVRTVVFLILLLQLLKLLAQFQEDFQDGREPARATRRARQRSKKQSLAAAVPDKAAAVRTRSEGDREKCRPDCRRRPAAACASTQAAPPL